MQVYEDMTFERIMERCLSRIPDTVDKREGSIIFDAIAPLAAELAIAYIELGTMRDRAFLDTAAEEDLDRKAHERNTTRKPASSAVRKGIFGKADGTACDVPIGARFSGGDINYVVTEQITAGQYQLRAEEAGTAGNSYIGVLYPIDYIADLASAEITDVLIPGEEEEDDESLRERCYETFGAQAFGGNQADYKATVKAIAGVGAVKVVPVWNGGGTVKLVLLDSLWAAASSLLVSQVQEAMDPVEQQGLGVGLAPIDHKVTVVGATEETINISCKITFDTGFNLSMLSDSIEDAVESYLLDLRKSWEDSSQLVVRISQIETHILAIDGVLDIADTAINNQQANAILGAYEIPVLGSINVTEVETLAAT